MSAHDALVGIARELALDLAAWGVIALGVWALVTGAGRWRSWRAGRDAADRNSEMLRAFERRRSYQLFTTGNLTSYPNTLPRMSKALRDAITREATE